MSLLQQTLDMFLPANCALCARPPKPICDACLNQFHARQRAATRGSLPGWALCDLDDALSKLISVFKEQGRFAVADQFIGSQFDRASGDWLREVNADFLVPMPSARKNFAKRGFSPANRVAERLGSLAGIPLARNALRLTRSTQDQAGLDAEARATNLSGAMRASRRLADRSVLIVDDIVTTGASVLEAARAIKQVGGIPVAFFALGETLLRNAPRVAK